MRIQFSTCLISLLFLSPLSSLAQVVVIPNPFPPGASLQIIMNPGEALDTSDQGIRTIDAELTEASHLRDEIIKHGKTGFLRKNRLYFSGNAIATTNKTIQSFREKINHLQAVLSDATQKDHLLQLQQKHEPGAFIPLVKRYNQLIQEVEPISFADWASPQSCFTGDEKLIGKGKQIETSHLDFNSDDQHECRSTSYGFGMTVEQNPKTGEIVWDQSYKAQSAVTGFEADGSLHFEASSKAGFSSDYDPEKKEWVLNSGGHKMPSASVYNPHLHRVESKVFGTNIGVGGVYNPVTQEVEWQTGAKSGVAGYFDATQKKVIWAISSKSGSACISRVSGRVSGTSSFFGGELDDSD